MHRNSAELLASPISGGRVCSLEAINSAKNQVMRGKLEFSGDRTFYEIVSSVPLLAPRARPYFWRHPTLDILFGEAIERYRRRYGQAMFARMGEDLQRKRSKSDIYEAFMRAGESSAESRRRGAGGPVAFGVPKEHYFDGLIRIRKAGCGQPIPARKITNREHGKRLATTRTQVLLL